MNKVQNNQYRQVNSLKQIVKANQRIIQDDLNQILRQNNQILQNTSPDEFVKLWFELNAEERSKFILQGQYELSNFLQQEQNANFQNVSQILQAFNFFDGVHWHYKITNKFIQNVCNMSQHFIKVLAYMKTILQGYFSMIDQVMITSVIDIDPLQIFQAYFQSVTEEGFTFLWEVAIDKVIKLVCENKSNINYIVGFNFYHTITFIDIKFTKILYKDVKSIVQYYHNETKNSYYRKGIDSQTLKQIQGENEDQLNLNYLFIRSTHNCNSYWELNYNLMKNDIIKWLSHKFTPLFLNKQEYMIYQSDESCEQRISKIDNYILQSEVNIQQEQKDLILKFADFTSSSQKLVDFLLKIPNFNIKLTDQQQQIIGIEKKIIFTGRSGTGKTTCLILRLLAMKHLFKLRMEMHKRKNPQIEIGGLYFNCLFITNNNILSIQAKNYFLKLNNQVLAELEKNKQKRSYQHSQLWGQEVLQDRYKQNIETQSSLNDISIQQDYSLFLTIQQLIFLIDSYLNKPFFSSNQSQDNNFQTSKNNQDDLFLISHQKQQSNLLMKQEIDLENQINFIDMIQQQLKENYNQNDKFEQSHFKDQFKQQVNNQQIDFRFFLLNFWQKRFSNNNLNPHFVWTYIYSHIKGCSNAHEYPGHYISKSTFLTMVNNNKEFHILYDIFIQYEKWKRDLGYYDLLDVVNHILVQLKQDQLCMPQIHYLFIDEIQDLPEAIILLFEKITLLGTIYSGDTAQNISKGVGFRFLTIQELSQKIDYKDEYNYNQSNQVIRTLNQNFRSNSKILNLANSIVSLIQMYFPKTIDNIKKESSNFKGIKPILVNGNLDLLFYLFEGLDGTVINQEIQQLPIELGFNSVIIVKNQEIKKNIPKLLQHILVLSIDEVKGLEFENVILYNFFTDTCIGDSEWKLLQTCEIIDEEINKQAFLDSYTKEQIIDYYTSYFTGYDDKNGNVLIKRMIPYIKYYDEFSYGNSGLCNELKQLYIAITRSRKVLYIFDEKPQTRRWIEQIWTNLHLIQIFDQFQFDANLQIKSKVQWQEHGKIMFQKQLYEQAEKCFQFSEDYIQLKKAKGFKLAFEGCQLILSLQQENQKNMNLKDKDKKINNIKWLYQVKFQEAAQLFQDTHNLRQAAQCFYFCEQYDQASQIYASLQLFQEAGEAAYKSEQYLEAAKFFLLNNDISKTLDSYDKANEFEQILQVLYQQKDQIKDCILIALLEKYFPIFLKKLTMDMNNKQRKYINNLEVLVKQFMMSEINIEDNRNLNKKKNSNNQSEGFPFQQNQFKKQNNENISDTDSTFFQQNNDFNFQEESLFQFDLDKHNEQYKGEGLPNLNQINFFKQNFQQDQNSKLDKIYSNQQSSKIKDSMIRKLFKYVSMFSSEFEKSLLKNSKNQTKQKSNYNIQIEQLSYLDDQQIDLDSIDQQQIFYVLDVLNKFQNYKLYILICNRYSLFNHLIKQLSKVVISLSPLLQSSKTLNAFNQFSLEFRDIILKKGQVASNTLDEILQMIDSQFLNLRFKQEDLIPPKNLGTEFYTLSILLGYWKQIIYQIDFLNSLSVCQLFMDYKNWKCIYWMNIGCQLNNMIQTNDFKEPKVQNLLLLKLSQARQNLNKCQKISNIQLEDLNIDQPITKLEIEYAIIYLEQYYEIQIIQLIANYKIPKWLYFRESTYNFNEKTELNFLQTNKSIYKMSEDTFKSFFDVTKLSNQLINQLIYNIEFQNTNVDDIQLFQSVYLILFYCQQILHNKSYQQMNKIENMNFMLYSRLIESLNSIIKVLGTNQDNLQKHRLIIIRSILIYFKVRQPDNNSLLHPFLNSLIVHISSIILEEIIKQKDSAEELIFVDIELNFILAPRVLIMEVIRNQINSIILDLNDARKKCLDNFNHQYSNSQDNLEIFNDYYNFEIYTQYWKSIFVQNNQFQQQNLKQDFVTNRIQKHQKQFLPKSTIKLFHKSQKLQKILLRNPYLQCNSKYFSYFINYQGLNQMQKQYRNQLDFHRQMISSIILLNYSNCNYFTLIFLNNKIIIKGFENQFSKYLDFLKFTLYKKQNMIDQATQYFFNYILSAKEDIMEEELIYNIIFLFLYNIIGLNLNLNDRCRINIPKSYINYFNHIHERKENIYYQQITSNPIQNSENLYKILEQLIYIGKTNPDLNKKRIQQLIYIIILNLNQISQELKVLINDALQQIKEIKNNKELNDLFISLMNQPLQIRVQILQKDENISKLFNIKNKELFSIEFEKQENLNYLEQDFQLWIELQQQCKHLIKQSKTILKAYRIYKQRRSIIQDIPKFAYGEYHFTQCFKVSQFINVISKCIKIRNILIKIFYQTNNTEVDFIFKHIHQLKLVQEIENEIYNSYLMFKEKNQQKIEFIQYFSQQMEKCEQMFKECSLSNKNQCQKICFNDNQILDKQETFKKL